MPVDIPMPWWLCFLVVALPGVWYLGRAICARALGSDSLRESTLVVAVAIWLLGVHVCGLIGGEFQSALVLGTLIPGIAGYALRCRGPLPGGKPMDENVLLAALGGTAFIGTAVVFYDFHDKLYGIQGHFSLTAHILNGIYPPRDIAFPEKLLSYHYGVATLFASVTAILRCSVDQAIDLMTLVLWFYTLLLFGRLGIRLWGGPAGAPAAIICAFGGGIPWIAGFGADISTNMLGLLHVAEARVNLPITSFFFQHAWTIGLPEALVFILCLLRIEEGRANRWTAALLGLLYGSQAYSNGTLFLALGPSAVVFLAWIAWRRCSDTAVKRGATMAVVALGFGLVLGLSTSSLLAFATGQTGVNPIRIAPGGVAGTPWNDLVWNAASFGLMLPAGIVGLATRGSLGLFFGLLIAGGIFVVNVFKMPFSEDMVKFATVANIALLIQSVGAYTWLRRHSVAASRILMIGLIVHGISFHGALFLNEPGPLSIAAWRNSFTAGIHPDDLRTIAWLRRNVDAADLVLRRMPEAFPYGIIGGLPQFMCTALSLTYGHPREDLERRWAFLENPSSDIDSYHRLGVRYVVANLSPEAADRFGLIVESWVRENVAPIVHRAGDVVVCDLNQARGR